MRVRRFLRECVPPLPRGVWLLNLGVAVNMFGFGLVLPWEIVYFHEYRGFALPVAGLVLSTVMGVGALSSTPAGVLVDRFGGKRVLFAGMTLSAVGYGALAFGATPSAAFAAAAVAGVGFGSTSAASPALSAALVGPEQRPGSFAVQRLAANAGAGLGGLGAGFIVADNSLRSFQALYLANAVTFLGYLVCLAFVPDVRTGGASGATRGGYRAVLRDRAAIALLAANVVFIIVGATFFGLVTTPYGRYDAHLGPRAIGLVILLETLFVIVVQLPVARIARDRSRLALLRTMTLLWSGACLAMLPAAHLRPTLAVAGFVLVGCIAGLGQCLQAVLVAPMIAALAPPALLGRYMAMFALSMSTGYALGPAIGSTLFAASHVLPWIAGAASLLALTALLGFRGVREPVVEVQPAPAVL
jgi:MFS family permease